MLSSRSRSPPKRPRQAAAPWAPSSQKDSYDPSVPTGSPERRRSRGGSAGGGGGDLGLPKPTESSLNPWLGAPGAVEERQSQAYGSGNGYGSVPKVCDYRHICLQ